jgi:hypothetical protein
MNCTIVSLTCKSFLLKLEIELTSNSQLRDDSTYSYFQERRRSATSDLNETPISNLNNHVDVRRNVASVTPDFASRSPISLEEDRQNERFVHAVKLLLAARDRVLTLSEQRVRVFFSVLYFQSFMLLFRHSPPSFLTSPVPT